MGAGCGRTRAGPALSPQVGGAVLPGDAILGLWERWQPPALEVPGTGKPLCGFSVPVQMCCPSPSPSQWCLLDHTEPWHHMCSESEDVELEAVTPQRGFFRVGLNLWGCCCILAPSPLRGILQLGRALRWAE